MNKKTMELNRTNNMLDKQISSENKEAFIDIICYLRGSNISEYHQELVRQDLTEMVLSAQQRGENIASVIGEDYQAFCDNVIASLPPVGLKQRIVDFFEIVCGSLSVLGIINIVIADGTIALIRNFLAQKPLNFYISVSLGSVILAGVVIIAAYFIVTVIMKNSFQIGKKQNYSRLKLFLGSGGTMAVFLMIVWFGRRTLFTIHIFNACVAVLVLYIVHKILAKI